MRTLYIECNMGAAGDMLMAALYELLDDKEGFLNVMNHLGLPGVRLEAQPGSSCGIAGTHMQVTVHGEEEKEPAAAGCGQEHNHGNSVHTEQHHGHCHEQDHGHDHGDHHGENHKHDAGTQAPHGYHHHASPGHIARLIDGLELPEEVKRHARAVYDAIAEAEAKDKLKDEEAEKDKISALKKAVDDQERELPKYEAYEELCTNLQAVKKELSSYESQLADKNKSIETLKASIAEMKEELAKLDADDNIDLITRQIADETARQDELSELQKDLKSFRKLEKEYKAAVEHYEEKRALYETANAEYVQTNRLFMDAQAGLLAKTLMDGIPCPVCGSVEHPEPAALPDEAPTEDGLKRSKKKLDKAMEEANTASGSVNACQGKMDTKKESVSSQVYNLLGSVTFEEAEEKAEELKASSKEKEESLNKRLTILKKNVKRKKELEEKIPKKEEQLKQSENEKTDLTIKIAAGKTKAEGLEKQASDAKSELTHKDKAEALQCIAKTKKDYTAKEKALEALQAEYNRVSEEYKNVVKEIKVLSDQLKDMEEYSLPKLEEERTSITAERNKLLEAQKRYNASLTANRTIQKNIIASNKEYNELETKYRWISSLSNTANGLISGKDKIMLETYIQTTYFEHIIRRANLRFMIMSDGQYELKRSEDAENLKSQSGLELSVIDHYNGTTRSVKTLSGGESFLASLSLALGLSDEIQSSVGGVQIDTMFVDEGFGTLDADALEQAYSALASLTDGHRLVGIISHVDTLKEKISKQIVVTKGRTGGSTAEISIQ